MNLEEKWPETGDILRDDSSGAREILQGLCDYLHSRVPHYDWVGFYFMDDEKRELWLGPYAGEATEHEIIPYGRGVCGQVAVSGETLFVPDVKAEDNYIACSIDVRSEIVIPVYSGDNLIAQLDIDSHRPDAFGDEDRCLLAELCRKATLPVTEVWKRGRT